MKTYLFIAAIILSYSSSQANDTLYHYTTYKYDSSIKYVHKMILTKDSGWLSLSYNSKNILITRAYYEDTTGRSPLYCHFYYREETGILKGTSCFKNGKKDGPTFGFNDRGDIMWTTTYDKGKFVSET